MKVCRQFIAKVGSKKMEFKKNDLFIETHPQSDFIRAKSDGPGFEGLQINDIMKSVFKEIPPIDFNKSPNFDTVYNDAVNNVKLYKEKVILFEKKIKELKAHTDEQQQIINMKAVKIDDKVKTKEIKNGV